MLINCALSLTEIPMGKGRVTGMEANKSGKESS